MQIAILGRNIRPPWNEAVKNMGFELARQLSEIGHKVHLVTTGSSRTISEHNVTVHNLPPKSFWRAAIKTLLKLEAEHEVDVVHLQNLVIFRSFAPFLGSYRRRSQIPVVAYCCQLPGLSFSTWVEVLKQDIREALGNKLAMLTPSLVTKWTLRTIDKTIASSKFIRDNLAQCRPLRAIEVISPFLNPERLRLSLDKPRPVRDGPRILYLGSHKVLRGEQDFLVMLGLLRREYPKLEGTAVTNYPIPDKIRKLVRAHGLDGTVRFLPRETDLDIPSLLKSADLYVFTGLSPVGSIDPPLSIVESMVLGTPVVSYDTGGISEILDKDNLVKYGDHVSMAKVAHRLLGDGANREERPGLLGEFSSQRAVKLFEDVYQKLA